MPARAAWAWLFLAKVGRRAADARLQLTLLRLCLRFHPRVQLLGCNGPNPAPTNVLCALSQTRATTTTSASAGTIGISVEKVLIRALAGGKTWP